MIAVAVYVLVVEPQRKRVRSSTGSGFSMLVTPWKRVLFPAVEEDADGDAWNLQLLGERGYERPERIHRGWTLLDWLLASKRRRREGGASASSPARFQECTRRALPTVAGNASSRSFLAMARRGLSPPESPLTDGEILLRMREERDILAIAQASHDRRRGGGSMTRRLAPTLSGNPSRGPSSSGRAARPRHS
jgi:hypothetical protein